MLTYDAKFYLKNIVTREDCIQVFTEWVKEGKGNNCKDLLLPKDHSNYKYENDKIKFLIKTFDDSASSLTACRLTNHDKAGVFTVSIIFMQGRNGESSTLLVQQDFASLTEDVRPPKYNRPYIVKIIFDKGWIDSSKYFTFGGKPYGEGRYYFNLTEKDISATASCLSGKVDYDLPIVYISYDYPNRKYHLSENKISHIAKNLLGTAYVLVEPANVTIIDRISLQSKGAKVYRGYIGIYFPKKDDYIYLRCDKNIEQTLNKIIWTLSIQEKPEEVLTWEVLLKLCDCSELLTGLNNEIAIIKQEVDSKQAILDFYEYLDKSKGKRVISYPLADIEDFEIEDCRNFIIGVLNRLKLTQYSIDSRPYHLLESLCNINATTNFLLSQTSDSLRYINPLNIYAVDESFTTEAKRGESRLNELKNKLFSIESKLSKYSYDKNSNGKSFNLIICPNNIEEFFEDEINDVIMICIETAKRIDNSIEEKEYFKKIVEDNCVIGNGRGLFEKIKMILSKTDQWDSIMQKELEDLGFTFTNEGGRSHPKGYFKDKRYSITISSTPSDRSSGSQNTAHDIISKISIYN